MASAIIEAWRCVQRLHAWKELMQDCMADINLSTGDKSIIGVHGDPRAKIGRSGQCTTLIPLTHG
jgi:hypothetical protein